VVIRKIAHFFEYFEPTAVVVSKDSNTSSNISSLVSKDSNTNSINSMSANSGRGGASRNGGRSRGRGSGRTGRGNDYSGSASSNKKGLCSALGSHVFDYGQRGSADQTKTSYEALTRHAGTVFGPDIGNELQNRQRLVIPEPTYSAEAIAANQAATLRRNTQHQRIEAARKAKSLALAEKIKQGDTDAMLEQAILLNEMEEADHKANLPIPITLEGSEYTKHSNECAPTEKESPVWKSIGDKHSPCFVANAWKYYLIR
jgi:hypothetical protein